jgi:hypothetical protein
MAVLHLEVAIFAKSHRFVVELLGRKGKSLATGDLINKERYKEVLACLNELLHLKHPEVKDLVLQHDSAQHIVTA